MINSTLNMQALQSNFQTVPIHSDQGNFNSTVYQGYDANMCPIIGEIQMFELANKTNVNATFSNQTKQLYQMFLKRNMNLTGLPLEQMTLEDFKAIIQEIQTNNLELRYVPDNRIFDQDDLKSMTHFMQDYYYLFLQGNDTVTQLSNTAFFSNLIFLLDERARRVLNSSDVLPYSDYL